MGAKDVKRKMNNLKRKEGRSGMSSSKTIQEKKSLICQ